MLNTPVLSNHLKKRKSIPLPLAKMEAPHGLPFEGGDGEAAGEGGDDEYKAYPLKDGEEVKFCALELVGDVLVDEGVLVVFLVGRLPGLAEEAGLEDAGPERAGAGEPVGLLVVVDGQGDGGSMRREQVLARRMVEGAAKEALEVQRNMHVLSSTSTARA